MNATKTSTNTPKPHKCTSASDYGSSDIQYVDLPAAASEGCTDPKELRQATVTYNSLMTTKRIQSESPVLGTDGQYLLHRVESHGRRLIGKAMTDSLRYAERWEKRTRWRGYLFEFHSRGVVLSKDVTHMILVNKRSQMDVESVTKQKCKAWNCTDKRKWKRGTNALSMHGYPVLRWDLASLF